jgi:hypothetical protein
MAYQGGKSTLRVGEVLNALERCFLAGDSPGVKMAAGFAVEIITGSGMYGRALPLKTKAEINFAVSVTLLSSSMDAVLLRCKKRGYRLPRALLDENMGSISSAAHSLSWTTSGDETAELALLGRPLSVELWDDQDDAITIGLNYLAISRDPESRPGSGEWEFTEFKKVDLKAMDQRECLALSEMLSTMGIINPYEMEEDEKTPLNLISAA